MLRSRHRVSVTLTIAVALLVCHGAMGSLHLFPTEAGSARTASHETSYADHGSGQFGFDGFFAAHHDHAEVEYFAVLFFVFAAFVFALRSKSVRVPVFEATGDVAPRKIPVFRLPRGPTLPSLQVFRL